jgi:hypothetical protein
MAAEHRSCERFQRTELKQQRLKTQTVYTSAFSQRIQQNRQGRSLMRSCRNNTSMYYCRRRNSCMCDKISVARFLRQNLATDRLIRKYVTVCRCEGALPRCRNPSRRQQWSRAATRTEGPGSRISISWINLRGTFVDGAVCAWQFFYQVLFHRTYTY